MTVISIKGTELYKKFNAIRSAGFDLIKKEKGYGWELIDKKNPNANKYIETDYKSVDEALESLADHLNKEGYIITK
ncbi:MAG TPA: hypothetical protein GXZ90_09855 [Clostridiales bacterium]|nr:hypothetical protein [Clostridiales bacterium]